MKRIVRIWILLLKEEFKSKIEEVDAKIQAIVKGKIEEEVEKPDADETTEPPVEPKVEQDRGAKFLSKAPPVTDQVEPKAEDDVEKD